MLCIEKQSEHGKKQVSPPRQIHLGPGLIRFWNKTRGTGKQAQLAIIRDWTAEAVTERSKLWPMFGNLQEAQAKLAWDASLQISAKVTPKTKSIYSPSHPSHSASFTRTDT